MSENKEKNIKNEGFSFILEDIFPNPFDTFRHSGESIKEAVKSGNIFIDTNVLLLPYSAGGSSIEASGSVYKKISNENRLYIPSQVIREYLKNRPKKVGELLQKLSDSISKFPKTPSISHPVLEGMREFDDLKQKIDEYTQLRKEIIDSQSKLHDAIVSWNLIDPVLDSYRENIPDSAFVNCEATREDIIKEVKTRYAQSIPPGYKDSSKDDGGIGDFIIWKTILEIGKKTQRSTIFVSGEEKSDWQYRSNNSSFLPRLELIDEYRRTSNGGSFFIIQLSELFSLLEVSTDTVEKIKLEEHRINAINNPVVECPDCGVPNSVYLANFVGASATPSCKQCGSRFHVHRTGSGITIHSWGATSTLAGSQEQPVGDDLCSAQCPECESNITFELGLHQGSTRWFDCETCNARLSAHRKKNHDILLKSH